MRSERAGWHACCLFFCLLAQGAVAQRLPDYERVVLDNGIVLLLVPHREVPIVAFDAFLRGGTTAEPVDRRGVAALTASLLERGAGARDAKTFVDAVADVGGEVSASPGLESMRVRGSFMAKDVALMVELLADLLMRPRFDAQELDNMKARTIELIRAAKDSDPSALLGDYGQAFLFRDHPYGRPLFGDEASIEGLTRDDVVRYYAEQAGADRLFLVVAGDFEPKAMRAMLGEALAGMPKARAARPVLAAPARGRGHRVLLVDKPDATQTYFWIGSVGVSKSYEGQAALELANTAFGGSFTSMLNTELRVKSGLSYGARSSLIQPSQPGWLEIDSFTRTEETVRAIDVALETLERLRAKGIDAPQLESVKAYTLGQHPLGFETASQIAGWVAALEFYGLPRSYVDEYAKRIQAVDVAAAVKTIREVYPVREDVVFVLIGNASAIREQVTKYGAVTEQPITAPYFASR